MKSELRKYLWFSRTAFALCLGVPFLSTGCGNPAASKIPSGSSTVSVAIVPSTATVPEGGSLSFVAMVTGANDTTVRWSVQEATAGGSITSKGVYTAPNALGTYHVIATSAADDTASASSVVKIGQLPGTFTAVGSMTTARVYDTATLLSNGKVLIAGGSGDGFGVPPLASAELYDPSTRTFAPTGSLITPRSNDSATLLADGRVLIVGGTQGDEWNPVFTSEVYDPSTGAFTATGGLISFSGHAVTGKVTVLLPDGKVFVAAPDNAEIYDPQSGTFTLTGPYASPSPTFVATATLLANGKILAIGCADLFDPCDIQVNELFDPQSGTFGVTGPTPGAASWQPVETATLLTDGRVLFLRNDSPSSGLPDAEVYDPAAGTFASIGSAIEPHAGAPAIRLTDGTVLIPGGELPGGDGSACAELYVPATGTFQFAGEMTTGRSGHTATLLPDSTVLITGGYTVYPHPTPTAEFYRPGASGASAAPTSP